MPYPLCDLNPADVERFLALGAVKYSFPVCRRNTYSPDPEPEFRSHCGLVYFWSGSGDELGYANTFGCPIKTFNPPRLWDDKIKANQKWFDLTPGKSEKMANE